MKILLALTLTLATVALFAQTLPTHKPLYYTCPMHTEVHKDAPGECPKCGMNLEGVYKEEGKK